MEWALGLYLGWCLSWTLLAWYPLRKDSEEHQLRGELPRWAWLVRLLCCILQVISTAFASVYFIATWNDSGLDSNDEFGR